MHFYPYSQNLQTDHHFLQFKQGDEAGLSHLYAHLYNPLLKHGLRIVKDEFVVSSAIQEAFLKAWGFRERLTCVLHTYRFLRLNVTWKCYNHYREPAYRLYRNIIFTDNLDWYSHSSFHDYADNEYVPYPAEEMLQTIYRVLPYLPPNRQTILTLYFKYGFSYNKIAKRFATSNQAVSLELQKGLEHLKKIIHSKKKLDKPSIVIRKPLPYEEILDGELLQLFKLRYEMKLSFEAIAARMNLSQTYVQQQYITAHARIRQMTRKHK
jgi:RNA polymerase sigma factor (sigma-70 family)